MKDWADFRAKAQAILTKHKINLSDVSALGFNIYRTGETALYIDAEPYQIQARLDAKEPVILDLHSAITVARLNGFIVEGWP